MRKIIFLYFVLLLIFLSTLKRSTDTLQQDAVYKFIQILDFQHQNFNTLKRYIPESSVDKWRKFQIYKPPFVYQKSYTEEYLVFPWLFNILASPFYFMLDFGGLILLPILFGAFSIWAFYKLLGKISKNHQIKTLACYFYILCTPLIIYSSTLYEATLCNFLLYFSLYLFLDNQEKNQKLSIFFFCGIIIGFLIFFRAEVFFLANLFILFFILPNFYKNFKVTFSYSLGVICMLALFTLGNKILYDSYLPLRVISITNYSFSYRLFRILDYTVLKSYSFLFYFPLCFSSLYFFFSKNKYYLKFLFPTWIFFFLLPIIAPQQQGLDMTPRFFFPIVPILGFFSFLFILEKLPKKRLFYFYLFFHSASLIFSMMFYVRIGNLSAHSFKKTITPFLVEHNVFQSNIFTLFSFYKDREKNYYLTQTIDDNKILLDKLKEEKNTKTRFFFIKNEVNEVINFNFTSLKKIYEDPYIYIFEPY